MSRLVTANVTDESAKMARLYWSVTVSRVQTPGGWVGVLWHR